MPAKTITIMPDCGFSPWAWEKAATDETTYVGTCIADAECGIYGRYPISKELEREFGEWSSYFEWHNDKEGFDWPAFHRRGLELSRRLKAELGDRVKIVYAKPCEDPDYKTDEQTEIV